MRPLARPLSAGFSLLEVMVAIALLSLGMVLLLQVQARSISLAQEARDMTMATQLLRMKLLECQADLYKKGFSVGDYNEEGNFADDDHAEFFWECHAYKPDMPVAEAGDITEALSGSDPGGAAADAAPAGADMGMGFIAPILSQMSSVLGDSIREMVVIVRWGTGADMQEMTATTHLIDKTAVNNIAAMLSQQCKVPGAEGSSGGGESGGSRGGDSGGSKGGSRGGDSGGSRGGSAPGGPIIPGVPTGPLRGGGKG